MRFISWLPGTRVDDDKFGGHVTMSEPIRTAPGAKVWCNVNMAAFYRDVGWMPDGEISDYVTSVDGWLKDDYGNLCTTSAGRTLLDVSKVNAGEIMRIIFRWGRNNPWIDGFWLEMLAATCPIPGWGRSSDWARYWDEAMDIIQIRNRSLKWDISVNGYHESYAPRVNLDPSKGVNRLKLEGGLWRPDFPDLIDHHDIAGGKYHIGPHNWIDRMELAAELGVTATLEVFAQGDWSDEKINNCIRCTAALAKVYDADYTGHIEKPGFWTEMDPWFNFYDELLALRKPTQANVVRDGEVYSRKFENGQLLVNPYGYDTSRFGEIVPAYGYLIRV